MTCIGYVPAFEKSSEKTLIYLAAKLGIKIVLSKSIRLFVASICFISQSYAPQVVRPLSLITASSVHRKSMALSFMV